MNKEILLVVDVVANEKGVNKEIIFNALECALASAAKKHYGNDMEVRVAIDRQTGEYRTSRCWQVVETVEYPQRQVALADVSVKYPAIQVGELIEDPIESVAFDRIGAQTAKQVIVQKIREAERSQVIEAYRDRQGELVGGVVKRVERDAIILDLGNNVEALIARDEMIPREAVRVGDRLRAYLRRVKSELRGPQLFLSRTVPEMITALFNLEVPEISEQLIEIVSVARDPGLRAKVAVAAKDLRIDPVGACVGMRGSRIQAISNELAGERIDIVIWDENPAQFVMNSMSPAEVISIVVDEDAHSMDIAVREHQLSQAIGKGGQNVKLASQLTGWNLNVMTESQAEAKNEAELHNLQELFMNQLGVDDEIAAILVQNGLSSIEEIAYVPLNEMTTIEEFDEEIVKELRNRAKDVLLIQAIANEEEQTLESKNAIPKEDLLAIEGMSDELAQILAKHGIVSADDLAEQSVDDLLVFEGINEEYASKLIMAARQPWFANEKQ